MSRSRSSPATSWSTIMRPTRAWSHSALRRVFEAPPLELMGHSRCVNRLAWNSSGSRLASVSDDCRLCLWSIDALTAYSTDSASHHRRAPALPLACINTPHRSNMFGVTFLAGDNAHVVTCAMDSMVCLHTIDTRPASSITFRCHSDRVKAVTADPRDPFVFFSASEDGTVRQFDARTQHACGEGGNAGSDACGNVLIDFRNAARRGEPAIAPSRARSIAQLFGMLRSGLSEPALECKCLAVHPYESHIIAVGGSDAEIRVFDRRMLTPGRGSVPASEQRASRPDVSTQGTAMGASSGNGDAEESRAESETATQAFARCGMPGLLCSFIPANVIVPQSKLRSAWYARRVPSDAKDAVTTGPAPPADSPASIQRHLTVPPTLSATHVAWSTRGDRILASLNPDQVYAFDFRPSCAKSCAQNDDEDRGELGSTHHVPTSQLESETFASCASAASSESAGESVAHADHKHDGVDEDEDDDRILAFQYPVDFVGNSDAAARRVDSLLEHVQSSRERGNECFKRAKYSEAIQIYEDTLVLLRPDCWYCETGAHEAALLLSNLAAALLKRRWRRDTHRAMLAAAEAVRLDASFVKARFRLAQALRALGELQLAQRVTSNALAAFPDSEDVRTLSVELERVAATVGAARARASERTSVGAGAGAAAASATSASPALPAVSMHHHHSVRTTSTYLTASQCYSGHLNMQTDIKEASFAFDDRFVLSGSDDGCLYVYDATSGHIVHVQIGADEHIVNSVQPHPHWPALACSGIAETIRFWEPRHWTGPDDESQATIDVSARVAQNQSRMSG